MNAKALMSRNKREGRYYGKSNLIWGYVEGWGWAGYYGKKARHQREGKRG